MNIDPTFWGESLWKIMYCIGASLPLNVSAQQSKDIESFFQSLKTLIPCENCRANYCVDVNRILFPAQRNKTTVCEWIHAIEAATNSRLNKPTLSLADRLKNMEPYMTPVVNVHLSTLLDSVPTELDANQQNKTIPQTQNQMKYQQQSHQFLQNMQINQQHQFRQPTPQPTPQPTLQPTPQPTKTIPPVQTLTHKPQQSNKKTLAPPMSKKNKMVIRSGGRMPKMTQKVHAKMPKQISLQNKASNLRYIPASQAPRKPCNCGNKIL